MGAALWTIVVVVLGPLLGWACAIMQQQRTGAFLIGIGLVLAACPIAYDWWQGTVGWTWLVALLLLHLLLVLVPYGFFRSRPLTAQRLRMAFRRR